MVYTNTIFLLNDGSKICFTISLTPCMIYRVKTGNIHSEFMHPNWITLFTIQVLNIVCFLNIWYTSLTAIHSNLEHGVVILTESFSPLKSELHNHPWWIQNEKCGPSYTICFYIMCTQLDPTGLNWFQLVPANQSNWCKVLTALLEIFTEMLM